MNSYFFSDADRKVFRTFDNFDFKKSVFGRIGFDWSFKTLIYVSRGLKWRKKFTPEKVNVLVFSKSGREKLQTFDKNSLAALSKRHSTWPE